MDVDWNQLFEAYFRCLAALHSTGIGLIADCPLHPRTVLLQCEIGVLREREDARGDRWPGLAEYQQPLVKKSILHELELDTSRLPLDELGRKLLEFAWPSGKG